jgi:hypothetical protein
MRRSARFVLTISSVLAFCLPLLACYEEPVRDHLHIVFAPGPAIVVTAVREVASPEAAGNPAVEDRLDEARSDLASGWDRWSRSFAELDAVAERSTIERLDGEARRGIHSALLDSFRPLERLLGNEGFQAFYDDRGEIRELQLHPVGSGQATREQRERLDRALVSWSHDIAGYLSAAGQLYDHLDRSPDRAVPCFAHLFDVHPEDSGPLADREEELVAEVKQTIEDVAAILVIEDDRAHSPNELSRLVFDTFQGRLTITPDGSVTEVEGFVGGDGFLERPPVSLWRSLESIVGRWLEPDVVTTMVVPAPEDEQPEPDPVAFASRPRRRAPTPDAALVESVLRSRLRPEEVYRVRWRTQPDPDDDDDALEAALALLNTAEQDLPN